MDEFPNFLTAKQLAEKLSVGVPWVYKQTLLKGPGSIPRTKVGKYLRFEPEKVLAWLAKQQK